MKTKAISSFFVLFALAAGTISMAPAAFADHSEVSIGAVEGSGFSQDCVAEGCYTPSTVTVDVGGVVIMTNTDESSIHTFTAGTVEGFAPTPSGVFDSDILNAGDSFEWNPEQVGEIPYYCMLHTWMQGSIIVQEAEAEETHEEEGEEMHTPEGEEMHTPEGDPVATGMLSDGTAVEIYTSVPTEGEWFGTTVVFTDSEHVNYDITVTQNGETVMEDTGKHSHDGTGIHSSPETLSSSDPVDITVTFQGYGVDDPKTGPIGEEVVFSNVVPEFGTIAMMVLAVAIISIVAVTAKSRVVPRF